jgi:hypothetical protein
VTSLTPLFIVASNLITVSATTGVVSISFGGPVASPGSAIIPILHNGGCNLTLSGTSFSGGTGTGGSICIDKTSTGTITINGTLLIGTSVNTNLFALRSNNGNTIINGNVDAINGFSTAGAVVSQTAGNITVNGNVNGSSNGAVGISFSGVSLTINGNTVGGALGAAVSTSGATNTITGNVTAGTAAAISSTSANIINVTGTVTASATANAIVSTNANGQVYLNGNMVNNNGKMAIYAPIVWLDRTGTTSASFFTSGGSPRTLYSEDTVPNTPAVNNVRSGTIYGAGNTLVGTIVMPTAANVRNGVVYDNGTTGTALFTTSLFLTELSSSTVPVAVRMQNLCTPMILGELMEAFKK